MKRLVTGRLHYFDPANQIVLAAAITGRPSAADLTAAIQKAVRMHAISSSGIALDSEGNSFFTPVSQKDVPVSVRREAYDLPGLIEEQRKIPFDVRNGDFFRFFLYDLPQTTYLVVVASHLAGDGLSILYLVRDVLSALAAPNAERPVQPLRLMEDFGYPADSEPAPLARFILRRINRAWNRQKRVFGFDEYLLLFDSYWQTHAVQLASSELSGPDLSALVAKCKSAGVTINSAIAAALLSALQTSDVGMAVSVRPDGYEGMGNYASGISTQYRWNDKESFWDNARSIHEIIHKKLGDNRKKYYVLQSLKRLEPTLIDSMYFSLYADFPNKTAQRMLDLSKYSERRRHTTSITNLARPDIPVVYGSYTLDSIEFVPPLIATSRSMLGVVTVGSRMTLTMQYEKSDRSRDYETALGQTVRILKSAASGDEPVGRE